MDLALIDIFTATIITYFILSGLFSGAIKTIIKFVKFITTLILTSFLYPLTKNLLIEYFVTYIQLVTIMVSFVISGVITSLFFSFVTENIKELSGNPLDKFLGIFAGMGKGLLYSFVFYILALSVFTASIFESKNLWTLIEDSTIQKRIPKTVQNSYSFPYYYKFLVNLFDDFKGGYAEDYMRNIILRKTDVLDLEEDKNKKSPIQNIRDNALDMLIEKEIQTENKEKHIPKQNMLNEDEKFEIEISDELQGIL